MEHRQPLHLSEQLRTYSPVFCKPVSCFTFVCKYFGNRIQGLSYLYVWLGASLCVFRYLKENCLYLWLGPFWVLSLLSFTGGYYLRSAYGALSLLKKFQEEQAAQLSVLPGKLRPLCLTSLSASCYRSSPARLEGSLTDIHGNRPRA